MKSEWVFLCGIWSSVVGFFLGSYICRVIEQRRASRDRVRWNRKLSAEILKAHRKLEERRAVIATVERLYWRFAHRQSCGLSGVLPDGAEVVRKELLQESLVDKTSMIADERVSAAFTSSDSYFCRRRVFDVRLRCRKCGRLHFQHFAHFVPVSHE